jgi:hypothetical protein
MAVRLPCRTSSPTNRNPEKAPVDAIYFGATLSLIVIYNDFVIWVNGNLSDLPPLGAACKSPARLANMAGKLGKAYKVAKSVPRICKFDFSQQASIF